MTNDDLKTVAEQDAELSDEQAAFLDELEQAADEN